MRDDEGDIPDHMDPNGQLVLRRIRVWHEIVTGFQAFHRS